ncbi:MAG: putative molybdenum carrier protein [Kiritimatiellia bacterium]
MSIAKIVSGGQTGVDRGALEAALKLGFPYGGMVPNGRKAEDGIVPLKFAGMTESDSDDYRVRTRWNAEHSDATLILAFSPALEGGTLRTRQYCMNARKPFFVDNPAAPATAKGVLKVAEWLDKVCRKNGGKPLVLNVAGPRESKSPGIAQATEAYVSQVIEPSLAPPRPR